jgi:hypothetical protein
MRRWITLFPALAVAVVAVWSALPVGAAQPGSGTLSWASPSLTWTNSSSMTGSTPTVRQITCPAELIACDDFKLTIDRGTDTTGIVDLKLVPSAGANMQFVYYEPGCTVDLTSTCYQSGGTEAHLLAPKNGTWTVRVACTLCVGASYSMTAKLAHFAGWRIPAAGSQTPAWAVKPMPGDPSTTSHGEPGISANAQGSMIVNTFGPTVWISTDNGATFSNPIVPDPTPCNRLSGDADAQVAFDNSFYVDNLCLAGGTNLSFTSQDAGKTWQGSLAGLPAVAGADSDRQWYAVDPKNAGVVYFTYHDIAGPNVWVLKSTDHGHTFLQLSPITLTASNFVDTSLGNTVARPLVDPTDAKTITVMYTSNGAMRTATAPLTHTDFDLTQIYMAQSHDGGQTWTNTKLFDAGQTDGLDNTVAHDYPQSTIDNAGNIYVTFAERLGNHTQTHIQLGVIPHGTTTMRGPWQIDQGGLGANVFASAVAGDPGMVDISWYGSPSQDNNDHGAQWSEMFAQSTDALSSTPHFTQSRISGNEPVHAADICLAGFQCLFTGGNRNLADFQSIAVDPRGYAVTVWTDDHTGASLTMFGHQTGGVSILPSALPPASSNTLQGTVGPSGAGSSIATTAALPNTGGASSPGAGMGLLATGVVLLAARARRPRRSASAER